MEDCKVGNYAFHIISNLIFNLNLAVIHYIFTVELNLSRLT